MEPVKTAALSSNTSWYLYNFRASTLLALREQGYRVICLAPEDEYSSRLVTELGCEWLPLHIDNQGSNPFRDAALIFQFWRYYGKYRPDVACHFTIKNNVYGTWAAVARGIPVINNIPGLGTAFTRQGATPWIARQLYRLSQRFAHTVFCQNDDDMRILSQTGLVPSQRLHLLPGSGVDLTRFRPSGEAVEVTRPFRFLYAGRMLRYKGLTELRIAMSRLNQQGNTCSLWLSGFSGSQNASALTEEELRNWAEDPWIEWLGPCDHMESIYKEVDCVVLPSYYREGTPRALLEAGAMGLPIITTDAPGCNHLVEDGVNGFSSKAMDVESLTHAMSRMSLLSQDQRERMGLAGRKRIEEQFDEAIVINATLSAIESAIANNDGQIVARSSERAGFAQQ